MTDEPLTPDHDDVIWVQPRGITIGASDDHMEVHLPPESASIQTAPVYDIVSTDEIEGILWEHGYKHTHHYTDIIDITREALCCGRISDLVYCYSVVFAGDTEDQYRDDIKRHFRGGNYEVRPRYARR